MSNFRTENRKARIRHVIERRQPDLTLVMDNIWDPHNVAAVLRSCDAFGVGGVHLYYTTSSFPDIGRKSSASARKWVERHRHSTPESLQAALKQQDMQVLCTGFTETAKPLTDWDLSKPTAVILSNEHSGIKPELEPVADGMIYIPMQGMVQSLNVSVAAAIILYEAFRQRHLRGMYDQPSYSEQEMEEMFDDWCGR